MRRVVIIGAGGHAKVVMDILKSNRALEIIGCTDKQLAGTQVLGVPVLGDDSVLPELYGQGVRHAFIAIGDNKLRRLLARKATELGYELINAVSPHAYVAEAASLGAGVAVMAGAVIHPDVRIGDNSIINTQASVDHDCVIGEACHVAPGATLSGTVTVGDGTFLGTGTKVIDGVRIGSWSVLGAGSVVVKDIPDSCLAFGVPARIIRQL
ncbi:acetyltransferase [Paenibacillus vulneris]|uniref:Acetyltransferase n=1 Tax=Paenibacillus vulneris TaxID=1133364 RepID=A0ABW3UPU0_9BACL|nr:acetyltransferase [Paenibacillus sp. 32352]